LIQKGSIRTLLGFANVFQERNQLRKLYRGNSRFGRQDLELKGGKGPILFYPEIMVEKPYFRLDFLRRGTFWRFKTCF